MWLLAAFALAGGLAQLVDGTLGMGFGVTSATVLLALGVAPATASAATHVAKMPTTLVSGLSHWRAGNVDRKVLIRVAIPGAIGGFLGAVVLTSISLAAAKSSMAALLLFFGFVILVRFGFGLRIIPVPKSGSTLRWLGPIGLLGGFVDATGGGGWGPVVTPSLMTVTRHEPRKVVGTTNAAEFIVALSVSSGFITGAVHQDIPWLPVIGLIVGGVIAAPIAARLAGRLPHAPMGTLVGGMVILVNAVTIIDALGDLPGWLDAVLMVAWLALVGRLAWGAWGREKREADPVVDETRVAVD
ncbi:sulfite exporter TauE/SafE family protein [Nocardioides sp. zg-536]|uniref:Probable membrane transporter protein n=1 Tax=Nocardioides faecalis TaxID=2803858 RepID=A0A939BV37_9ACTN|nr:sulfite exporter TauE/SafE family protein [Nocardioides faecalis]MBM9459147.1 sulfite exporter TauE/SafE family protein [Nocardioides faecalis]MBS4751395.1 sulfite exporter TauE/SafE family protein [Nocardioides faecalis]QVI59711.1 sulfite exporter TauE/SafE family protein [Nocardioides faecalis]